MSLINYYLFHKTKSRLTRNYQIKPNLLLPGWHDERVCQHLNGFYKPIIVRFYISGKCDAFHEMSGFLLLRIKEYIKSHLIVKKVYIFLKSTLRPAGACDGDFSTSVLHLTDVTNASSDSHYDCSPLVDWIVNFISEALKDTFHGQLNLLWS